MKAKHKQTSVSMKNQAFDECVLLHPKIITSLYVFQALKEHSHGILNNFTVKLKEIWK